MFCQVSALELLLLLFLLELVVVFIPKLLTLEQYRDAEMAQLYQQYLCAGPLGYLSDLFASLRYDRPQERALAFYAPMFFLYSVYDGQGDTPLLQQLLNAHWAKMWAEMGGEG